jgi:hypothetical protein
VQDALPTIPHNPNHGAQREREADGGRRVHGRLCVALDIRIEDFLNRRRGRAIGGDRHARFAASVESAAGQEPWDKILATALAAPVQCSSDSAVCEVWNSSTLGQPGARRPVAAAAPSELPDVIFLPFSAERDTRAAPISASHFSRVWCRWAGLLNLLFGIMSATFSGAGNCTVAAIAPAINSPLSAYPTTEAQIAVYTLATAALTLAATAWIWIALNRRHRLLLIESPLLCAFFVGGIALLYVAATVSMQRQTSALCSTQLWLYHVGFSAAFGSLFLKTWRLVQIFGNNGLQVVTIPDRSLLLALLVWLASISAILMAQDLTYPVIVLDNPIGVCAATHQGFALVLVVMQSCMMMAGTVLVYSARQIPSRYNRVRYLAIATIGTLGILLIWFGFVWGLAGVITVSGSVTTLQSIIVIVQSNTVLCLVLGPKFIEIRDDDAKQTQKQDGVFVATRSAAPPRSPPAYRRTNRPGGEHALGQFHRQNSAGDELSGGVSQFLSDSSGMSTGSTGFTGSSTGSNSDSNTGSDSGSSTGTGASRLKLVAVDETDSEPEPRQLTEVDLLAKLKRLLQLEKEETEICSAHEAKLIELGQQVAETRGSLAYAREMAEKIECGEQRVRTRALDEVQVVVETKGAHAGSGGSATVTIEGELLPAGIAPS